MKHALVEEQRREAEPGLAGRCPVCGSATISKCGNRRVWHWAHYGVRQCDRWWEPETSWHRDWKNRFPSECQEIVHYAADGEKHIADVKMPHDRVIEFQHSYLDPAERRAREAFYRSMIWVVDGLRLKRSRSSFYQCLSRRVPLHIPQSQFSIMTDECKLLQDWADSRVGVFFDFGEVEEDIRRFGIPVLWRLSPKSPSGLALLNAVRVTVFVEALLKGEPINVIAPIRARPRCRPLFSFEKYLERRHRARPRF